MVQALSWTLSILGAAGLWMAVRGGWVGWAFLLAIQPVWVVFDILAHAEGLILSSVVYAVVAVRNLYVSRRVRRADLRGLRGEGPQPCLGHTD